MLALLNSKLIYFYLKNVCTTLQGGFYDFRRDKITTIPVSNNFKSIDIPLTKLSNTLIGLTNDNNTLINKFQNYLQQKFGLEKLTKKLQNWHELEFGDFIKELYKAIKVQNKSNSNALDNGLKPIAQTLTKKDEFEWLDLFEENKQKAQELQNKINKTDQEIDQMVYKLYNLTPEEITIVEQS